jgi:hypothetical protein
MTRSSLGSFTHSEAEPGTSPLANSSSRRLPQKNGRPSGDSSCAPSGARPSAAKSDSVVCVHSSVPARLRVFGSAIADDTKHSSWARSASHHSAEPTKWTPCRQVTTFGSSVRLAARLRVEVRTGGSLSPDPVRHHLATDPAVAQDQHPGRSDRARAAAADPACTDRYRSCL